VTLFKKAFAILAHISNLKLVTSMDEESDKVLQEVSELCHQERELEAEVIVKEQLADDPDNLEFMTKLGEIQARLCNDYEAESTFRAVLVRNPNHEGAVCNLGRLLDQALRTDEAELIYRDFLQNNPAGHNALDDLCRILFVEERVEEALKLARDQITRYGSQYKAYDALRYLLEVLEDGLDSELYDDRENEALFTQLMDNLLEQLDLVIQIESTDDLPIDMQTELNDDRVRLIGEIEELLKSAVTRGFIVPPKLDSRIKSKIQTAKRDS
jgi:tetratricopeptide (TPR) repeat protein